jgi:penicillin V acylase-like amidase (Ntn superfamily)
MSDLKSLTFYIWTYDNRAIRTISLNDVDLEGSDVVTYQLDQPQAFTDLAQG